MRGSVNYVGQTINYRARHSARKTLAISVHPDGDVEVVAPEGLKQQLIEQRLLRRAGWVLKQQRYFDQFRPRTPERRFIAGETHLYLGRQYRLKIEEGDRDRARLKGGFFWISVSGAPTSNRVRELMTEWYREHARAKLTERYMAASERYGRQLPRIPALSVAPMKQRWGSYSANGRITLNVDLIRAPVFCIDYVVLHELLHARYSKHGRAFFNLLDQMMPDWRERKVNLERVLA
ncbi:M48 family metallopeptidase [Methylocystis sp. Sn-Cys]|uniref:M48 family metallopeptidase n=1 Tax=Methylocystis sp. Sn-Cys TaxID=1701263 RepID=UPI0019215B11|nr:SprT family zinc-dependent metalloprotease [Methylocystis sp. Sn-Cys]MBL1255944.1 M48 family metallopeptidase [Methylocystis sp. Sn-Cys]